VVLHTAGDHAINTARNDRERPLDTGVEAMNDGSGSGQLHQVRGLLSEPIEQCATSPPSLCR
jgi:hypothetical protein